MRTVWTTDQGPDPALRQTFAADRPAAVAAAVVGGIDVLVTLVDEHEDFDCHLGDLHHERCPEHGMRIWDRATGTLIRAVPVVCDNSAGYPAVLVTVVVGGRPLAVVRDWARPPKVVDLETGRRIGTLPGHEGATEVQDIATVELADGPAVVTAGWDGILRVTVLPTGRTTTVVTGERSNAVAVVRIGGRPVAATGRDAVTLWDLTDGSRVGVLAGRGDQVAAAIVSWPDGDPLIAVLDTGGGIGLWDVGTGRRRPLGLRPALRPWSIATAVAADGRRLLAVEDGEAVSLWDVHADAPFRPPLVGPVRHARMLADGPGTLVIGSSADDAVSVWRLDDGGRPYIGAGHRTDIRCLTVTPNGRIVAGSGDGTLSRWRLADGVREPDLDALPGRVNAVAAVPHGTQTHLLAVGGEVGGIQDGMLHRWTDERLEPAIALDHRGATDIALTFSVGSEPAVLTAGCDGQVHLTQIRTGLRLGTISQTYQPRGVAIGLMAGQPAAAISWMFGPFTVWDLATRTEISTPAAANVRIGEAARAWIDTDIGPAVVTVHGSLVRLHHLLTGAVSQLQPGHDEPVTALAADDPARPAAVAIARTDSSVAVVDATADREVCRFTLPYPATALAWAPRGLLVAACRRDLHCVEVPGF
ncbi:WD40 repeat domain-containing protein [Dactylosporangium sp. NPDC005572]|uniref:WD40 repeat domain-containing protein n=1 Tax=Dactylosporangium sp. NPDC005572 TaxID=3156889 RepID=UPI0033AE2B91